MARLKNFFQFALTINIKSEYAKGRLEKKTYAARMGHTTKKFMKTYVHVDRDINDQMNNLLINS